MDLCTLNPMHISLEEAFLQRDLDSAKISKQIPDS